MTEMKPHAHNTNCPTWNGVAQFSPAHCPGDTKHAESMLTPGETRTAPAGGGMTVVMYAVANGTFTHVRVVRPDGSTHFAHSYRLETDALRRFAELRIGDR